MKKSIAIVILSTICMSSGAMAASHEGVAKPYTCGFSDIMSIQAPAGATIQNLTSTGGLKAVISPVNHGFLIEDNGSCQDGTVTATIGTNSTNYSTVQLTDGPYLWNPNVMNVKNVGNIQYQSMNHPVGSNQYTLLFK